MRVLLGLLCVLPLACKDDDKVGNLPDAPPAPDAPDVTSGLVRLTITVGASPQPGVKVYFQNADSSLVAAAITDANGVAAATMEPGGYVTAIEPFPSVEAPGDHELRTFAGVKPGDELVLHETDDSAVITVDVVVPTDPSTGPDAELYLLHTNCGQYDIPREAGSGADPGGTVALYGCGSITDLIVESLTGEHISLGSFSRAGVALADNTTLDLSSESYAPVSDSTWSYTNAPEQSPLALDTTLLTSRGPLFGRPIGSTFPPDSMIVGRLPTFPGALAVNKSQVQTYGPVRTWHAVVDWAASSAPYSLDFADVLLADFAAPPMLVGSTVSWTAGSGAQPDLGLVELELYRDAEELAWSWNIAAPAGTSINLPVLPAEAATYNPRADDRSSAYVTVAKVPGGYDAIRAIVFSIDPPEGIVSGATGRVVLASAYSAGQQLRTAGEPRWSFVRTSSKTRRR